MNNEALLRYLFTEIEKLRRQVNSYTSIISLDELKDLSEWQKAMITAGYTTENVLSDAELMRQWTKINTLRQLGVSKASEKETGMGCEFIRLTTQSLQLLNRLIDNCYTNKISYNNAAYNLNVNIPNWIGGWLKLPTADGRYTYELNSSNWIIEVDSQTKTTALHFLTNTVTVGWDVIEGYVIRPQRVGVTYVKSGNLSRIYQVRVSDEYKLNVLFEYEGYVDPSLFPSDISTIFVSYLEGNRINDEFLINYLSLGIMDIYDQLNLVSDKLDEEIKNASLGGSNATAGIVALNQIGELKKIVPLQYNTTYTISAQNLEIKRIYGIKYNVSEFEYTEIEKERIYPWRMINGKLADDDGIGVYAVPIIGETPKFITGNGTILHNIGSATDDYQVGMEPYMYINFPRPLGTWSSKTRDYDIDLNLNHQEFSVIATNDGGTYTLKGYVEMELNAIDKIATELKCNDEYLWFQPGQIEDSFTKFRILNSYDNLTPLIKLPIDHESGDPINLDQTVTITGTGKLKIVILNDRLQLTGASFTVPELGVIKVGDKTIQLFNIEFVMQSIKVNNELETVAYVGTYEGIELTENDPLTFTRRFTYNTEVSKNTIGSTIYEHSQYENIEIAEVDIDQGLSTTVLGKPGIKTVFKVVNNPANTSEFRIWYRNVSNFRGSQTHFIVPIAKTYGTNLNQNYVRGAVYAASLLSGANAGGNIRLRPAIRAYFTKDGSKCYIWTRGDFGKTKISDFLGSDWTGIARTYNGWYGTSTILGKLNSSNTPSFDTTASNDFHSSFGYVLGPHNLNWIEGYNNLTDSITVDMSEDTGYKANIIWNDNLISGTYKVSGPENVSITYKILPIPNYIPPEFLLTEKAPTILLDTLVTLNSIESVTSQGEIWLPEGSNNLTQISEYLISLGATITAISTIMTEFNSRLNTLEERVSLMDEVLESLIRQINRSSSTLGTIGSIASLIGGSIANFLPIVGTAITLLGDVLTIIDSTSDGDWLAGGLSLMVALSLFGYTNHKYIQKLRKRRLINSSTDKSKVNLSQDTQNIIGNRMGTTSRPGKIVNGIILSPRTTSTNVELNELSISMTTRQSMGFVGGESMKLNLNEAINQGLIDATGLPSYKAVQLQSIYNVTLTSTEVQRRLKLSGRSNQIINSDFSLLGYGIDGDRFTIIENFEKVLQYAYGSTEEEVVRHFAIMSLLGIEDPVISKIIDTDGVYNAVSLVESSYFNTGILQSRSTIHSFTNLQCSNQKLTGLSGSQSSYESMDQVLPIVIASSEDVLELLA